jgi:hypothetical protein
MIGLVQLSPLFAKNTQPVFRAEFSHLIECWFQFSPSQIVANFGVPDMEFFVRHNR